MHFGKDTSRARRRWHRVRMIRRGERIARGWSNDRADARRWATRNHDHLKACSCWMCGNFRRLEGPTIQERKALLEDRT